jgi:hypothetical protein
MTARTLGVPVIAIPANVEIYAFFDEAAEPPRRVIAFDNSGAPLVVGDDCRLVPADDVGSVWALEERPTIVAVTSEIGAGALVRAVLSDGSSSVVKAR